VRIKIPKQKCTAICEKIEIQFQINDVPERKLCFAIVQQAIMDLSRDNCLSAYDWLFKRKYIWPAEMCGVSSDWIRRVIKDMGR